jgi:hypothetical protein
MIMGSNSCLEHRYYTDSKLVVSITVPLRLKPQIAEALMRSSFADTFCLRKFFWPRKTIKSRFHEGFMEIEIVLSTD